jgi:tetratricopeptide (TPR) repeat protein
MILLAVSLLAFTPEQTLDQANYALSVGRSEQAREMIRSAVERGAAGPEVERLLADLAFSEKRWPEATERYRVLLIAQPESTILLERMGIAALQAGKLSDALVSLDKAVRRAGAHWRAWNARAVLADRQRDWASADRAYAAGLNLEPNNPIMLNNSGWSLLLRGRWKDAAERLSRAASLAPGDARIVANAELAGAANAADLPLRRDGEGDASFAVRLNDAGVIALVQGDRQKAVAAFARALETSGYWFQRAANNLAIASAKDAP